MNNLRFGSEVNQEVFQARRIRLQRRLAIAMRILAVAQAKVNHHLQANRTFLKKLKLLHQKAEVENLSNGSSSKEMLNRTKLFLINSKTISSLLESQARQHKHNKPTKIS